MMSYLLQTMSTSIFDKPIFAVVAILLLLIILIIILRKTLKLQPHSNTSTIIEQLSKAQSMLNENTITQEEFNSIKSRLLSSRKNKSTSVILIFLLLGLLGTGIYIYFKFRNSDLKSIAFEPNGVKSKNSSEDAAYEMKYKNAVALNSVAILLKDEIASRVEKKLGRPDRQGQYDDLGFAGLITYAVYFNKIKTNEGLQHLVLIARDLNIIGIFGVGEGEIIKAGKERTWIIVKRNTIEYNTAWAYGGGKYQQFNTTTKFGSY